MISYMPQRANPNRIKLKKSALAEEIKKIFRFSVELLVTALILLVLLYAVMGWAGIAELMSMSF